MYEYIKGIITELTPEKAIVESQGFGYKVLIPLSTYTELLGKEEPLILYLTAIYREDSQRLFGFTSKAQRDLFNKVCDVSGIGPKLALSLIGHMTNDELYLAIQTQDVKSIVKVPGLGKKTAERLIVEMKDKVTPLKSESLENAPSLKANALTEDALAALINLGYQQTVAKKAIAKVLENTDCDHLPQLITLALRNI